jgi:hypothetical protein
MVEPAVGGGLGAVGLASLPSPSLEQWAEPIRTTSNIPIRQIGERLIIIKMF